MANWNLFQEKLLKIEGGYQAHENDRGNYVCPDGSWAKLNKETDRYECKDGKPAKLVGTKYGIAAPVLSDWLGRVATVSGMKNLSLSKAKEIYRQNFWHKNRIGEINDQKLAEIYADGVVNHGSGFGTRMMQQVLNDEFGQDLKVDGAVGSFTLAAINSQNPFALHNAYKQKRLRWYNSQRNHPKNHAFVDGWLKRMQKFPEFTQNAIVTVGEKKKDRCGVICHFAQSVPAAVHSPQARREVALAFLFSILIILIGMGSRNYYLSR